MAIALALVDDQYPLGGLLDKEDIISLLIQEPVNTVLGHSLLPDKIVVTISMIVLYFSTLIFFFLAPILTSLITKQLSRNCFNSFILLS